MYSNFVSLFILSKRVMMVEPFDKMASAGITRLLGVKGQSPLHADFKDFHVKVFGPRLRYSLIASLCWPARGAQRK